jgi:hypothetical protein
MIDLASAELPLIPLGGRLGEAGGDAGELNQQAVAAGGGVAGEQGDDDGGGDDRAQQAHPADLAGRAEVAGEHGGQDDAVDDHRFGELGNHGVLPCGGPLLCW